MKGFKKARKAVLGIDSEDGAQAEAPAQAELAEAKTETAAPEVQEAADPKPAKYGDVWPPKREPAKLPTGWPGSKPETERKSGFYSKV